MSFTYWHLHRRKDRGTVESSAYLKATLHLTYKELIKDREMPYRTIHLSLSLFLCPPKVVQVCLCVCSSSASFSLGPKAHYVSHGNSLTDDPGLSLNSLSIKSCEMQIMKHLITTVGEPERHRRGRAGGLQGEEIGADMEDCKTT